MTRRFIWSASRLRCGFKFVVYHWVLKELFCDPFHISMSFICTLLDRSQFFSHKFSILHMRKHTPGVFLSTVCKTLRRTEHTIQYRDQKVVINYKLPGQCMLDTWSSRPATKEPHSFYSQSSGSYHNIHINTQMSHTHMVEEVSLTRGFKFLFLHHCLKYFFAASSFSACLQ